MTRKTKEGFGSICENGLAPFGYKRVRTIDGTGTPRGCDPASQITIMLTSKAVDIKGIVIFLIFALVLIRIHINLPERSQIPTIVRHPKLLESSNLQSLIHLDNHLHLFGRNTNVRSFGFPFFPLLLHRPLSVAHERIVRLPGLGYVRNELRESLEMRDFQRFSVRTGEKNGPGFGGNEFTRPDGRAVAGGGAVDVNGREDGRNEFIPAKATVVQKSKHADGEFIRISQRRSIDMRIFPVKSKNRMIDRDVQRLEGNVVGMLDVASVVTVESNLWLERWKTGDRSGALGSDGRGYLGGRSFQLLEEDDDILGFEG